MRSTRRLAALLAVLVLGASGCSAGGAAGDDDPLPDPVVETEVTSDVDYVALGDSFSAGPFIGTMRTDPTGCARSRDNYPAFLADWLDVATYTDVTCSAATTADLTGTMTMFDGNTTGPQLDAVTRETDLVTLGMGGNDFGIYDALIGCQEGAAAACPVDRLRADTAKVADNVQQAVRRIRRAAAPDATVYVVGYPDILPTEGTCRAVGVSADVLGPVTEVAGLLNDALEQGARRGGASYVDMEAVSEGHDVCAKGRAWVNGPRFRAGIAAPFHPKINGMRAVATEVYRAITGEDPEVTEYAEPDPDAVVLNQPAS
ncbi:SGNH/GDSL hydrolase family protein [Nocardioides sp. J2M5]|uniref:SGNH/GDSL hydrolase family protein n=1 Tax=Nocardioides palaemonis TaxID=2829810 RepID=UPI001BA69FA6|nr:SGNH/GDSL hydrolase family protein [Nocardioides palaemonis]MBS2939117.1 SGNH/GDSL hydrolase family protein [Nocardioides palaemonis]